MKIHNIIARAHSFQFVFFASGAAIILGSATAGTVLTGGFEGAGGTRIIGGINHGVDFISTTAQQLSALGFWDSGGDGLAISYKLGLWQTSTRVLLTSVTINSADALDTSLTVENGQWRYKALGAPLNLTAGTTYTMGFYSSANMSSYDTLLLNYPSITTGPTVTIINQRRFLSAGDLAFPSSTTAADFFYMSQLNAQFVPEPGVAALVSVAAFGLLQRRRIQKHQ